VPAGFRQHAGRAIAASAWPAALAVLLLLAGARWLLPERVDGPVAESGWTRRSRAAFVPGGFHPPELDAGHRSFLQLDPTAGDARVSRLAAIARASRDARDPRHPSSRSGARGAAGPRRSAAHLVARRSRRLQRSHLRDSPEFRGWCRRQPRRCHTVRSRRRRQTGTRRDRGPCRDCGRQRCVRTARSRHRDARVVRVPDGPCDEVVRSARRSRRRRGRERGRGFCVAARPGRGVSRYVRRSAGAPQCRRAHRWRHRRWVSSSVAGVGRRSGVGNRGGPGARGQRDQTRCVLAPSGDRRRRHLSGASRAGGSRRPVLLHVDHAQTVFRVSLSGGAVRLRATVLELVSHRAGFVEVVARGERGGRRGGRCRALRRRPSSVGQSRHGAFVRGAVAVCDGADASALQRESDEPLRAKHVRRGARGDRVDGRRPVDVAGCNGRGPGISS
jgi:hypothetical protein